MTLAHSVDRSSPLPLYAQVKRRLRTQILSWPNDSNRFHTEQALCEIYGVSRATIRQAVAELEEEGLLRRRQGSGTRVMRRKIDESFSPLTNFSDQWAQSGRSLKVELLRFERSAPCPTPFAEMLGLQPGDRTAHVERFRLSGAMRIVWDQRFIPLDLAEGIARREFAKVSLLDVLARKVEFERGESQLEAALAGEEHAERLELLPHDPVLMRHLSYFATDGRPVLAGLSVYRADQVRYKLSAPMRGPGANLKAEVRVTRKKNVAA
ncbi:MAG: GntR family transcriptional regulator [Caldimonas sp.]